MSNSSLNKNGKLSDIDSSTPNKFDQMWELQKLKLKNPKHLIIENLNINSISGKFDQLKCLLSQTMLIYWY